MIYCSKVFLLFCYVVTIWSCIVIVPVHGTSSNEYIAFLLGRTGDGKSTAGNLLGRYLGIIEKPVFSEGKTADSHTKKPQKITNGVISLIDSPGLMDSEGVLQDEKNILEIVQFAKREGHINGFLLVINAEVPRFDDGMKNAVKLLIDTFGPQMLNQMSIVFTRSCKQTKEKASEWIQNGFRQELGERLQMSLQQITFPFWQIDSHPEELASQGVPQSVIDGIHAKNKQAALQIRDWMKSQASMDVSAVEPGEYESRQKARKAKEEADKVRLNTVTSSRQECRKIELGRSNGSSKRYGSRCFKLAGPRKYKDFWTDVKYRGECITYNYNADGTEISNSGWQSTGEFTEKHNVRNRVNVC